MRLLALFVILFVIESAVPDDSIDKQWEEFKLTYKKIYKDSKEEEYRKKIFTETVNAVAKHNQLYEKGLTTFTMGISQFSDLTSDEFQKIAHGYIQPDNTKPGTEAEGR